jgi:serine/threonine-protein kinase
MSACTSQVLGTPALPEDLIRSQLARVEAHTLFIRSARMRRFLEFTIESALAGRAEQLKEYVLGIEVFGRAETHDPRLDPIVRVEARRLRAKLSAYYASDGAQDDLILEYPRGSYVPQFRMQSMTQRHTAAPLIAVLPFAARRRSSCARFADGLTREVIHELGRSDTVRVFSRETRGRARVEALLTGSVRQSGHRVRVTAELLSTGTNQNLWSANFISAPTDPVTAQKQIAFATAHALLSHFDQR